MVKKNKVKFYYIYFVVHANCLPSRRVKEYLNWKGSRINLKVIENINLVGYMKHITYIG